MCSIKYTISAEVETVVDAVKIIVVVGLALKNKSINKC